MILGFTGGIQLFNDRKKSDKAGLSENYYTCTNDDYLRNNEYYITGTKDDNFRAQEVFVYSVV